MKNLPFLLFGAMILTLFTGCDKEIELAQAEIPPEIEQYVFAHFPDHEIIRIIKEKDGFSKTYEVLLAGNTVLEFNKKLEIIEIDGANKLPNSVIPSKIQEYVQTHHGDNVITDWELQNKTQHVELDNEVELIFNQDHDFLRYDN